MTKPKSKANKPAPRRKHPLPPIAQLTCNEVAVGMASSHAKLVVFDLDGCLSDDAWRFCFVQERTDNDERFEHYHGSLGLDHPLEAGAAMLRRCLASGMHPVFITARPDAYRGFTDEWLERNFGLKPGIGCILLMRNNGDQAPTVDVKRRLMEMLLVETSPECIVAAYDDRKDVVTMYNAVFGVNAYVLDRNGVSDPLNLQSYHTRHLAPGDQHAPEPHLKSMDAAIRGTSAALRVGLLDSNNSGQTDRQDYDDVPDILRAMAETFDSRAAIYGSSGIKIGKVMAILFPNGYTVETPADARFMVNFDRMVAKLVRFVNSGLKHDDSVHDIASYAALCEADVKHHSIKFTP